MMRLLYGLFVILVAAVSLSAQTEDVRVSRPDPKTSLLPNFIKIQASSSRGDQTLVVWGSADADSTGQLVPVLYAQVVHAGSAVGQPHKITSPSAYPSSSLEIVPLQSLFLVLWQDDRPGGPGVYMVRIDSLGTLLGPEFRLSSGRLFSDSGRPVRLIGDTLVGGRLLWKVRSTRDNLYSVQIDSVGNPIGAIINMGYGSFDVLYYAELPGLWIIRLPDSFSWIVTPDGTLPFGSVSNGRFNGSHRLYSDSSMIALEGNRLVSYRHMFDSVPSNAIVIPDIDSTCGGVGMMAVDSSGVYWILAVHFTPTDRAPIGGYVHRIVRKTRVSPGFDVDIPQVVLHDSAWNGPTPDPGDSEWLYYYSPPELRGGLENSSKISWTYTGEFWVRGYKTGYVSQRPQGIERVSMDSQGAWSLDSSNYRDPGPGTQEVHVQRQKSSYQSIVLLTLGLDSVVLTAPVVPYDTNIAEGQPGVFVRHGEFFLSYLQPSFSAFPRLFRWDTSSVLELEALDTLSGTKLAPKAPSAYLGLLEHQSGDQYYGTFVAYVRTENTIASFDMQWRFDVFRYLITKMLYETSRTYGATVDLALPGPQGDWGIDRTDIRNRTNFQGPNPRFVSRYFGRDPNRRELAFSLEWIQSKNTSDYPIPGYDILEYRGVGDGSDSSHASWAVGYDERFLACKAMIPSEPNGFIGVLDEYAVRVRNGKPIDSVSVPIGPILFSARLLGPYYLLMQSLPGDTLGRSLLFYDIDNGPVFNTTIHLASKTSDYFLVQNPSDSVVGIIYGGDSGVHAAFISVSDRRLLKEDSLLSQTRARAINPAGLIWKNTLYVVWEDYRRGVPDIYSNRMVLPDSWKNFSGRDQREGPPSDQRPPTIVDGIWSVSLPLSEQEAQGPLRIELYNVQGQLLHAEDRDLAPSLGTLPISLSLVGNPPGAYFVVVRGAGLDHPRSYLTILQ